MGSLLRMVFITLCFFYVFASFGFSDESAKKCTLKTSEISNVTFEAQVNDPGHAFVLIKSKIASQEALLDRIDCRRVDGEPMFHCMSGPQGFPRFFVLLFLDGLQSVGALEAYEYSYFTGQRSTKFFCKF